MRVGWPDSRDAGSGVGDAAGTETARAAASELMDGTADGDGIACP